MPEIQQYNGAASLVENEVLIRNAEQLVTRCRTRYLSPWTRTNAPASDDQVRNALAQGGIIPSKIDEYLALWSTMLLRGGGGAGGQGPAPRSSIVDRRAAYNQQMIEQGRPPVSASRFRQIEHEQGQGVPPLPPQPRPLGPGEISAEEPIAAAVEDFQDVPQAIPDYLAETPFGGGRR